MTQLIMSISIISTFENEMTSNNVVFSPDRIEWEDIELPTIKELEEMKQILKFSVPLIKTKVKIGKELWKNSPTILW